MLQHLRASAVLLGLFTLLLGIGYPLAMTGIGQSLFSRQANGSLIVQEGTPVGSALIGQPFDDPKYFWSRLSATSPAAYNGAVSSGSNLGPLSTALTDAIKGRIDALRAADPGNTLPIPVDLVTASASGLDPHISPAAAEYQVSRVAKARNMNVEQVRNLIADHTQDRTLGVLGEPRVHVLKLNLALDAAPKS